MPWSTEGFDLGPRLPADWANWSRGSSATQVRDGALAIQRTSGVTRAWERAVLPSDFGLQALARIEAGEAVQFFLRGRDLRGNTPSYLTATISPQVVGLAGVQAGRRQGLGTVAPATWPTDGLVEVTVAPEAGQMVLRVQRTDTREWLSASGQWQADPTPAIAVADTAPAPGLAGIERSDTRGAVEIDRFVVLAPAFDTAQRFDDANPLPVGWLAWGSDGTAGFAGSPDQALTSTGGSSRTARAWLANDLPSDTRVSAAVRADQLIPLELVARGRDLDGPRATYYSASAVRGVEIGLNRMAAGTATRLATVKTGSYLSNVWLEVSLTVQGDRQQIRVRRRDTGQWLTPTGTWQAEVAAAINVRDGAITGPGHVGVNRPASFAGTVILDDFAVAPGDGDITPPAVRASVAGTASTVRRPTEGLVRFRASVIEPGPIDRVEFLVDGELVGLRTAAPYAFDFDSRNLTNGKHSLVARAWDEAGNVGESRTEFTVANQVIAPPALPRHFGHIRYAALAYNGTPLGTEERELLRTSVDLVVPNARYLDAIDAVADRTPQLVYSNLSNLYLDLLTDWLAYADRTNRPREDAFYHVAAATPFVGDSSSSRPVTWMWNVRRVDGHGQSRSLTTEARTAKTADVSIPGAGGVVYLGYPERFGELNVWLDRGARGHWQGTWEYPTATDASGRPTAWKALPLLRDGTVGLQWSERLTFDPPADWATAVVDGSAARLFYVRLRTTAGDSSEAPVISTVLGRDYVGANGQRKGTIPAFDAKADANGDGYLTEAEYANRRAGADARFVYESRLFYSPYGQMRFVTRPSPGLADWAGDYHRRYLESHPKADGLFLDNSHGKAPVGSARLIESTFTYASDYASAVGAIQRAIGHKKLLMANTAGGGSVGDRIARRASASAEEFVLRPMGHTWSQFLDTAELVKRRLADAPQRYLVLDALSTGGSPTDPRTRMAALAYYYLLADPNWTMFMTWGGEEPASPWSRHWFDAIAKDVGRPIGEWSTLATGQDPANEALSFQVLSRSYSKALVLYKPLSYTAGKGTGTTADATATTHRLAGQYRQLQADGSLGPAVTAVTLRNGEGAVLLRT